MPFSVFDLHPSITKTIQAEGFTTPTPIQSQAIPVVLSGRDLIGLAQTGTGKTAAFVLPLLHKLMGKKDNRVRAVVLTPTRELCEQVNSVIRSLGRGTGIRSTTVYGGASFEKQLRALRAGVDIIVACPGRLLDHMQQRTVVLSAVEIVVLDEADQMFDMGFLPNIRKILKELPRTRQSLMFSATMPENIRKLAQETLQNPSLVQVARLTPIETVKQALFPVPEHLKADLLLALLKDIPKEESVLVFTRTKHRAKKLGGTVQAAGYKATTLQGNLSQNRRAAAMSGFRNGDYQVMVATDIASRGIDVSQIFHVVNFDMPDTVEAYTHRIGRTGRASRNGSAYTFITNADTSDVRHTERALKTTLERKRLEGFDYNAKSTSAPTPTHVERDDDEQDGRRPQGRRRFGNASGRPGNPSGRRPEGRDGRRFRGRSSRPRAY